MTPTFSKQWSGNSAWVRVRVSNFRSSPSRSSVNVFAGYHLLLAFFFLCVCVYVYVKPVSCIRSINVQSSLGIINIYGANISL